MSCRPNDSGSTQYEGCACHEAGWAARLAEVKRERDALRAALEDSTGLLRGVRYEDGEEAIAAQVAENEAALAMGGPR